MLDHSVMDQTNYLSECKTRYYPNYFVHEKATLRTYYHGPFEFLHIAEAVFIESRTCELFTNMMLTSWYAEWTPPIF